MSASATRTRRPGTPDLEALAALPPLEKATSITQIASRRRTLPAALASLRRDALRELHAAKHTFAEIGRWLGLSGERVRQIIDPGSDTP